MTSSGDPSRGDNGKANFVLIDYENVQPRDMSLLLGGSFKVSVFVGATQAKLPFEMADVMQKLGADAEYVKIEGSGPNALDFHIAYYVGKLSSEYPGAYFHIISKDTGFDPLTRFLKARGIHCERRATLLDIPLLAVAGMTTGDERIEAITENLKKRKLSRPRKARTLAATINSLFGSKLSADELTDLLDQLKTKRVIKDSGGKITYTFSD